MKSSERYRDKTYAGLLGKNIGIRLGAPVEPTIWTYERIRRFYGEIEGYVKPFINFAADDDINGPFYFLRALDDAGIHETLDPRLWERRGSTIPVRGWVCSGGEDMAYPLNIRRT